MNTSKKTTIFLDGKGEVLVKDFPVDEVSWHQLKCTDNTARNWIKKSRWS